VAETQGEAQLRGAEGLGAVTAPMISSSFEKPSVTPTTMLLTRVRVRPCSERFCRSSFGRSTMSCDSSWRTVMAPGMPRERVPFGPFTVTCAPSMATSTPPGTAMGALPIRDMTNPLSHHT
jgi:hypothetical protein